MQFIEFLFEAFSIMALPILFGMLVALIVVVVILVSIIKAIIRKIQEKPQSSPAPQYNTYQKTYTPQNTYTPPVNSVSYENEKTETKPIVKAPEEPNVTATKFIPTASKYLNNKDLYIEISVLLHEADDGDIEAQCECGSLFMHGYLVKEDTQEAVYWYNKAAQQGSVEGHFQLGEYFASVYYKNDSKIRYFEEAREHLLVAAKENYKTSQNALAMLYCHRYAQYCKEKGLQTKEQREADPVYLDYLKKYKYWNHMYWIYGGLYAKKYKKEEQNFIE